MRKLLLLGLTAFVIIGFAALGINWNQRSSDAKEAVKSFLTSLNTDNSKVTYDKIDVSGFPMNMNISIINPRFTGQLDKIIKNKDIKSALKMSKIPEWNEDLSLDGNINIGINIFSNKFTLSQTGNFKTNGNIGGKKTALALDYTGSNFCVLELKKTGSMFSDLWNSAFLFSNKDKSLEEFRSLNCTLSAGKSINIETKEELMTFSDSLFSIAYMPKGEMSDIFFRLKFVDMKVTKAYDKLLAVYQNSFFPDQAVMSPSLYGNQNIEVDLSYSGGKNLGTSKALELPLEIKVNKFLFSNAAYNFDINAKVISAVKGDKLNSSIYYRTEYSVTDLFQEIIKEQFLALKNSVVFSSLSKDLDFSKNISNMPPKKLDELIYSVIPDFVGLGKMVAEMDVNYSGNKDFSKGQVNLKSFELSSVPYGITANATIKRDKNSMAPLGNLSLSCINCFDMIDSANSYFKRVKYVVSILDPKKSISFVITPEAIKAIKDFLLTVAPEKDGVLKFDLVNNGDGAITINGKNVMEVFMIFGQTVASKLQ